MSMENQGNKEGSTSWDLVITPKTGWFDIDFKELWQYRDLIFLFVKRDFVAVYKQTILGPLWYIIQPLLTTIVFTVIFGNIAKIPTDALPPFLFYLSGNVMFGYFSATIIATSNTFNTNAAIFSKVYFPRLTVPVSSSIVNLLQFFIQVSLFFIFLAYFASQGSVVRVTTAAFYFPVALLQTMLLSIGSGILVSSLTTKYKDLRFVMAFFVQIWMYATPVVYPLSQVPKWILPYYILNPMVGPVELFRLAFLGVSSIQLSQVITGWVVTITILFLGLVLFSRIEKSFTDTV